MRESIISLMTGMAGALLVIYALLAIPFRSFVQPVIIMVSIPFGFVGVVLGHLILGYPLSVISLFGFVALSGVVVNDSMILTDLVNKRVAAGMSPVEAVLNAGIFQFRPILLTTVTTFFGLGNGGEFVIYRLFTAQIRFSIPMMIMSMPFNPNILTVDSHILIFIISSVSFPVPQCKGVR